MQNLTQDFTLVALTDEAGGRISVLLFSFTYHEYYLLIMNITGYDFENTNSLFKN